MSQSRDNHVGLSMSKISSSVLFGTLIALAISSAPAHAQNARSFVSGLGNDANAPNCSRTAPCRTFQVAHDSTLASGEISVLDPGSYGAVTITKSISIINDGVGEAGALVSGGLNGININAGANDRISLRGLTVKGIGFGGGNGIVFSTGRFLSVENCVIRAMTGTSVNQFIGYGIIFNPSSDAELNVSNTVTSDNEGHGIAIVPRSNAKAQVAFNYVQANKNGSVGIAFADSTSGLIIAAIDNSVIAYNTVGIGLDAPAQHGPVLANVTRSVVIGNGTGFLSGVSGVIAVGQSNVTGNTVTWSGQVESYQDNYVTQNLDGNPAPPLGAIAKK